MTLTAPIVHPKRPWTLPAPWTRGRAHRALENGGPFPTAPTAVLVLVITKRKGAISTHGQRPANDNYPSPRRSPAGLIRRPFAGRNSCR